MALRTIGKISHTDKDGNIWTRRVARNDETGETERTAGNKRHMILDKTSRYLGRFESDQEALRVAQYEFDDSFDE